MWSEHWNTADPRAERELILRSERPFFQVETEKIQLQTWFNIGGVGRTGKVWMFSLETYFCTSLDLCAGASSWTSFRFHACLRLVELFCSICSVPKEHSLCSTPSWCSVLPCVVSVAQCPSSPNILCKVPSSRSGIALRFGAGPQILVPMLCSLLFSKVQNNIARFYHQFIETHWVAIFIHLEERGWNIQAMPIKFALKIVRLPLPVRWMTLTIQDHKCVSNLATS